MEINRKIAAKVLQIVDAGLCSGLGSPEPGKMCVEAAVCYALGMPHGDKPTCVSPALRKLKIQLNDSTWSSPAARAKGMRRLALAQLGSAGFFDDNLFVKKVEEMTIREVVPRALLYAAEIHLDKKHQAALRKAAKDCKMKGNKDAAKVAASAAYDAAAAYDVLNAANAAAVSAAARCAEAASVGRTATVFRAAGASDIELSLFAESVVQILIEMQAPGCQWLELTEAA